MNCRRCREVRYLWVDGELEAAVTLDFQRHRRACPECDELARLTAAILEVVRERAACCAAPNEVRQRIQSVLLAAMRPSREI